MPRTIRVTRKTALQRLSEVPAEKVFWCHNGMVFRNLWQLRAGLETMSDDAFRYHSNWEKTDFANWVRDVIGDERLAGHLATSETRMEAARNVGERLAFYEGKLT